MHFGNGKRKGLDLQQGRFKLSCGDSIISTSLGTDLTNIHEECQ